VANNRYEVGQTLFVVMVEKMKIVPVVVAEQVVRKTFKGEEGNLPGLTQRERRSDRSHSS